MFEKLMSTCTTSDHDVLRGSAAKIDLDSSSAAQHTGGYMYDICVYSVELHVLLPCLSRDPRISPLSLELSGS